MKRPSIKKIIFLSPIAVLLLVSGFLFYNRSYLKQMFYVSANVLSKETCSCVFVTDREFSECLDDLGTSLIPNFVSLDVDKQKKQVTGVVFGVQGAAKFYGETGCRVEDIRVAAQ